VQHAALQCHLIIIIIIINSQSTVASTQDTRTHRATHSQATYTTVAPCNMSLQAQQSTTSSATANTKRVSHAHHSLAYISSIQCSMWLARQSDLNHLVLKQPFKVIYFRISAKAMRVTYTYTTIFTVCHSSIHTAYAE